MQRHHAEGKLSWAELSHGSQLTWAAGITALERRSTGLLGPDVLDNLNVCARRAHHLLQESCSGGREVKAGVGKGGGRLSADQLKRLKSAKTEQLLSRLLGG